MSSGQNFDCFLVLQATKIVNNIFMTRAYNTKKLANFLLGVGGLGCRGGAKESVRLAPLEYKMNCA